MSVDPCRTAFGISIIRNVLLRAFHRGIRRIARDTGHPLKFEAFLRLTGAV